MKALSIPIALMIILVLLIAILVPAFIIFNSIGAYSAQGNLQGSIYQQQQEQQNEQVFKGNPNIYYNASPLSPYISFNYLSVPTPMNITQIYYFNSKYANWTPLLNKSVVIGGNIKYPLPSYVASSPIILVTSLGNIYFLNPNTSVVTSNVLKINGKIPIYITAYVINGSKLLPVHIYVMLNSSATSIGGGLTPILYDVQPGTYLLDDMNGTYIYLSSYGLTAKFLNWSLVGYGTLSLPNKLETQFTVYGPLVITALYNASLEKFSVTIEPYGLPLGQTTTVNGNKLTAVNNTVPVIIDGKEYEVPSSGITLNLTYGYHIVQFPTQFNITFNYSHGYFVVPYGQITTYNFTGLSSSTSKIGIVNSNMIFVNGSGTVYGNYQSGQTYYLITVENYFYFPRGTSVSYNSSPVLGDLAGQLIQINNTYTWGPVKNYQPQKFYVPANSQYTVTYDYLCGPVMGQYIINGQTYEALLSCPQYITIQSNTQTYYINVGSTFTASSPLIIVNYEEWEYGGEIA